MRPYGILVAAVIALASCPKLANVEDLSSLRDNQVVIVGRVTLYPPLALDEQKLGALYKGYRNNVWLLTDDEFRVIVGDPTPGDIIGRIRAVLGETFYVAADRHSRYLLGGIIMMEMKAGTNAVSEAAYLPGGLEIEIEPGDQAVYIGTIQYTRDEFFGITDVTVYDEYPEADQEFRQKFGDGARLRKSLAVTVKNQPGR